MFALDAKGPVVGTAANDVLTQPWLAASRNQVAFLYISLVTPLFSDVDTGIHSDAASQYQARPKAKRGIAIPSVEKFP